MTQYDCKQYDSENLEFCLHCQLEKKYESLKKLQRWKRQVENEVIGFFRNFDFSKNSGIFKRKNYLSKTVFSIKVLFYNIKKKIEKPICRKQFFLLKLTPFFKKSIFRKNPTMFTSFIYIFRIFLVFCSRCKIAEFLLHCQLEKNMRAWRSCRGDNVKLKMKW